MDSKLEGRDSLPVSLDFDIPFIDEKKDTVSRNEFGNLSLEDNEDEESTYPNESTENIDELRTCPNETTKICDDDSTYQNETPKNVDEESTYPNETTKNGGKESMYTNETTKHVDEGITCPFESSKHFDEECSYPNESTKNVDEESTYPNETKKNGDKESTYSNETTKNVDEGKIGPFKSSKHFDEESSYPHENNRKVDEESTSPYETPKNVDKDCLYNNETTKDEDEISSYPNEKQSPKQVPKSSQNKSSKSFPTVSKVSRSTLSSKLSSVANTKSNGEASKKSKSRELLPSLMAKPMSKKNSQQPKTEVKKIEKRINKSVSKKSDPEDKEIKRPEKETKSEVKRPLLAKNLEPKKPESIRAAAQMSRGSTTTPKLGTKEPKSISVSVRKPNNQFSKPIEEGNKINVTSKINNSGPNKTTSRPSTESNVKIKPLDKSKTKYVGRVKPIRPQVKSKDNKTSSTNSVNNVSKENPIRSQVKSNENETSSTPSKLAKQKESQLDQLSKNNTEKSIKPSLKKNEANNKLDNKPPDVKLSQMNLEVEIQIKSSNMPAPTFTRQISNNGDQLITFKDTLNPRTDFDQLERMLGDTLDEKEKQCMKDLRQYLVKKEDAWLLDHQLIKCIGALLEHRSLNPDIRVKLLRLLAAGALRDDFWSFLQMDRKERQLMKYPNDFEDLSVEEQKAIALFFCNNFSSSKGSEWLLYGSPWPLDSGSETSNVKITSKVAAYSLVSYTPSLQDYGSALIYNIAMKEAKGLSVPVGKYTEEGLPTVQLDYGSVSDKDIMSNSINGLGDTKFVTLKVYNDVTVELCIAVLKFIKKTKNPEEEILYRCVKSLLKFSLILKQDLMSCIAMVQTDLDDLVPGRSGRIDELWSQLRKQLVNNSDDVRMEM